MVIITMGMNTNTNKDTKTQLSAKMLDPGWRMSRPQWAAAWYDWQVIPSSSKLSYLSLSSSSFSSSSSSTTLSPPSSLSHYVTNGSKRQNWQLYTIFLQDEASVEQKCDRCCEKCGQHWHVHEVGHNMIMIMIYRDEEDNYHNDYSWSSSFRKCKK